MDGIKGKMQGTASSHEGFSLWDVLRGLQRSARYVVSFCLIAVVALACYQRFFPTYVATGAIFVDKNDSDPLELSAGIGPIPGTELTDQDDLLAHEAAYLGSRMFFKRAVAELVKIPEFESIKAGLVGPPDEGVSEEERLIGKLHAITSVQKSGSQTLQLRVTYPDQRAVALIANVLVEAGSAGLIQRSLDELLRAQNFLDEHIASVNRTISDLEDSIASLRREGRVDSAKDIAAEVIALQKELDNAVLSAKQAKSELQKIEERASRAAQLEDLVQKYDRSNYALRLRRSIERQEKRITLIKEMLDRIHDDHDSLPKFEVAIQAFTTKADFEYSYLAEVKKERLTLEIRKAALDGKIRVVDKSGDEGSRRGISRILKLAALLSSVFFGILLSYVVEKVRPIVRSPHDLEGFELGLFGTVPCFGRVSLTKLTQKIQLVDSPEARAYKNLRAVLLSRDERVVGVVSSDKGEGKSSLAAGLAVSLAQMRRKVLLVTSEASSLADGLVESRRVAELCSEDSGEPMTGNRFATHIEKLKPHYDFIIVDTPASLAAPDAMVLMAAVDMVLMIVAAGSTNLRRVRAAFRRLQIAKNIPKFFVMNRFGRLSRKGYGHSEINLPPAAL